jgi:predicted permease
VERRTAFFRDLTNRLIGLPGVTSAGAITHLPLSPESDTSAITVPDQPAKDFEKPIATFRGITPGYFTAMDIGLRAGRMLSQADIDDTSNDGAVVNTVISESLARRLWRNVPFENIVGRSFRAKNREMRIVGVIGEVRNGGLDHDPLPQAYIPPQYAETVAQQMTVVVRSQGDSQIMAPTIREEVWKLDKSLPVGSIQTMKEIVSKSLMQRRFAMTLVLAFAILALALAVLGTYSVLSYAVSQTTRELGIRIAMGAQRSWIILYVLKRGFQPAFIGLVLGLALGLVSSKILTGFLFGVTFLDPITLVAVSCVLLGCATLASFVPAWRAARIDPIAALRAE